MTGAINISSIKKAYFIGIGGIGMSALARFFQHQGVMVSGYDKTETALTQTLVYTPAIPADNRIMQYSRDQHIELLKRSDVLQIISKGTYNICIAGTHGKTTTSTMVAHILRDTAYGCNAFLGGISTNYQTNFWSDRNPVAVIEADEYDRSFLKLYPDVISISSMDPDHLDIYGTAEEMELAFLQFAGNMKENGLLLTKKGLKREKDFKVPHHLSYAVHDLAADIHVASLKIQDGAYQYDVIGPDCTM
jgi:UDP-N-acetylmuramate--alanine ligase